MKKTVHLVISFILLGEHISIYFLVTIIVIMIIIVFIILNAQSFANYDYFTCVDVRIIE